MGIMIFDYFLFTEIGLTMEVGPSKTRLQFDWCQDPSTDASIHWLLSDAPPNGELSNTEGWETVRAKMKSCHRP